MGEESPVERESSGLLDAGMKVGEGDLEANGAPGESKAETEAELKSGSQYDDSYCSDDDASADCFNGGIEMITGNAQYSLSGVSSSEQCTVTALATRVNAQLYPTKAVAVFKNTADKNKYDATDVILQGERPEFDPHNQYLDSFIQVSVSLVLLH